MLDFGWPEHALDALEEHGVRPPKVTYVVWDESGWFSAYFTLEAANSCVERLQKARKKEGRTSEARVRREVVWRSFEP